MASPGSLLLPSLILSFTPPTPSSSTDIDTDTNSDPCPNKGSTSDPLLFDFKGFLERGALDDIFGIPTGSTYAPISNSTPEDGRWEVTKLSGGYINITVRVAPRRGDKKLASNPRSVVIKYAPPYVAVVGEGAPFGTFRQVIESRALFMLGSTPSVTSAEAAYGVAIPRVLKFFKDERVLVLQDLGERMEPLDFWVYPPTTSTESPPSLETCGSVGTRLGNILASIHCNPTLLLKSQTLADDGRLLFENPDTEDLIRTEIVGKVLPILRPWIDTETGRIEKIAKIISQDFEHSFLETLHPSSSPSFGVPKSMFSMGDLWTGSIIAGASPVTSSSDAMMEVKVGLIDWEFASPARIGQDIAQLSAWLYLLSTSSAWSSADPRSRRVATAISSASAAGPGQLGSDSGTGIHNGTGVEGGANPVTGETLGWRSAAGTLMDTLLKSYARKVKEYPNYAWFVDEEYDQRRYKKERLAVIRSIWILFGREVIYNSVDAYDRFARFITLDGDGGEDEGEIKIWQKEMIEVGCWYVSVAGESLDGEFEEMVGKERVLGRMYAVAGCL